MNIDLLQIGTASMILFAVIDIIGSIPIVLDLKKKAGRIEEEKATLTSMIIMILFLFLGETILKLIGIDVSSFAIAGSLVLFFMALEMILGIRLYKEEMPKTTSVVPLAFPVIAGAGTMTSLISIRAEYETVNIILAIILNMIVVYLVLRAVDKIERFLGDTGIAIIRKVFGIILLAIAVKLFRTNAGV